MSPINRELIALGLTPKEAAVYLSLLELGTASVQAIARRANLVRPTTYVILERLARKGLASQATGADAKKMLFTAEDPGHLEQYVAEQVRQLEHRREQLAALIPELKSIYASGEEKPRVRLFEGKEGLRTLQQEFVEASRDSILGMAPEDLLHTLFPEEEYNEAIRNVRLQAGIQSRHIYTSSQGVRYSDAEDAHLLRESRFISPEQLPLKASVAVHGPLLSLVSFRSKIMGVLVEHEDFADSFRAVFEVMWHLAEATPVQAPSLTARAEALR